MFLPSSILDLPSSFLSVFIRVHPWLKSFCITAV